MPQLITIALVGGILWFGYRAFKREMERVGRKMRENNSRQDSTAVLKKGEDGIYRPTNETKQNNSSAS